MRVLITGAAKRLGKGIAVELAKQRYDIVIHYRNSKEEALLTVQECRRVGAKAHLIWGDFSSVENTLDFTKRYLKEFSDTYALINNVGDYFIPSSLETPHEEWIRLFHLNLHVPFIIIQHLLPSIVQMKGNIINIGVSGLLNHNAKVVSTAYNLSKEALWGLTRSLALELAHKNVRVNMVSPGVLEHSIDVKEMMYSIPSHRAGTNEEVARVIAFLLDSKSAYITGQNIEVAGGLGLK